MIKALTDQEEEFCTILVDSPQRAIEWGAVLESQNIPYEVEKREEDSKILFVIEKGDYSKAMQNIRAYEKERPFFEKFRVLFTASPQPLRIKAALPCVFFSCIISFFYFLSGPATSQSTWQLKGMLSNQFFSESRWWSPVTAITLHSDIPHLTGNIIFFILFGTAAAIQAGAGSTIFFVVISGILANLTTLSVFGDKTYNAIGFSTSVFGVLGILTTLRLMMNMGNKKISSFYFWIPLIAAVGLLGLTGGSAGSDLAGHFFGFVWGTVTGIALHFLSKFRKNIPFQVFLYFLTLGIIAFSWYAALK